MEPLTTNLGQIGGNSFPLEGNAPFEYNMGQITQSYPLNKIDIYLRNTLLGVAPGQFDNLYLESGDIDGDKDDDFLIYFAEKQTDNPHLYLLKNNGEADLKNIATQSILATYTVPIDKLSNAEKTGVITSVALADIDGDKDLDILIGKSKGELSYRLNDGSGNFDVEKHILNFDSGSDSSSLSSYSMELFDIDKDNDEDIVVKGSTSNGRHMVSVYRNNGIQNGQFEFERIMEDTETRADQSVLVVNPQIDVGDFNRDGFDDFIIGQDGRNSSLLYLNSKGNFNSEGVALPGSASALSNSQSAISMTGEKILHYTPNARGIVENATLYKYNPSAELGMDVTSLTVNPANYLNNTASTFADLDGDRLTKDSKDDLFVGSREDGGLKIYMGDENGMTNSVIKPAKTTGKIVTEDSIKVGKLYGKNSDGWTQYNDDLFAIGDDHFLTILSGPTTYRDDRSKVYIPLSLKNY